MTPADTDTCAYDLGTRASRMTYIVGEAVQRSLGAGSGNPRCGSTCAERRATGSDVAARRCAIGPDAHKLGRSGHMAGGAQHRAAHRHSTHRATANPGSFAAHFLTEVEVDTLTGRVQVTEYLAAHDIGRAINPMLVEGQIHGGIQIGLGYALYEDVAVDPGTGRLRGDSFARYTLANAPEMPPIRALLVEKVELTGPFGAKAVGEIATVAVAPALVNAVNAALGTRLDRFAGLLPERIIQALQN